METPLVRQIGYDILRVLNEVAIQKENSMRMKKVPRHVRELLRTYGCKVTKSEDCVTIKFL